MKLRVTSAAEAELADAVSWYGAQVDGLSTRFLEDVERAFQRIIEFPEAARRTPDDSRWTALRDFPYIVWYEIEASEIVVYAVAHVKRDPEHRLGQRQHLE